jgi:hypothetical protein
MKNSRQGAKSQRMLSALAPWRDAQNRSVVYADNHWLRKSQSQ